MMGITRKQFLKSTAAATLAMTALRNANAAGKTVRIATVTGADIPEGRAVQWLVPELEKASDGALKVEYLPSAGGGKLNDAKGSMYANLVEANGVDLVIGNSTQCASVMDLKPLKIWDMPFLFSNYKEVDTVLDGPIGEQAYGDIEKKGLKGLMYMENGFRNVCNDVRPINTPDDFKGLIIRTIPGSIASKVFEAMGAQTLGAPFPQVYSMLKEKKINAAECPFGAILDQKWHEVTRYLTVINYVYSPNAVTVSLKFWNTLAPKEQKILVEQLARARTVQRDINRKLQSEAAEQLRVKGMQVNTVSNEQIRRFENRLNKISASIAQEVGLSLWIDVNKTLNGVREKKL
ncbi:TRAP transporter substrate-binding protein DctP [Ottowia testudinis]|uniref:TRAP transporter substrate-binding protein DctP n=1 Tax=Ottowia testudinis TaxID=2816950 RepID=A0A975CI67_9BURK|nr:TRAP transporter substrate-binding protein DctP [Ottowia testudinis]QTD44639.1 TRAP transporter substrate-binding protein DctP [Ottowia testudinis]